eukprot:Gregarina_sp_Pseudo_9__4781@NODE_4_length_7126_cov_97_921970_g3_i0_p3_GENE_NODE_4_length_7126_cov_97_921970_g3_i0NODE_4_length_7126_cov_97_921970_g3_i0_p3_ORF_typecomplete_len425_score166_22DnaJ/PF00226_31/2e16DnaJ/PF00226_31/2_9e03DnaJ/PF00226_31/9_1e02DnaJ/PF00226_31/1_4e04PrpF/PF04303_13/0_0021Hva1_TUDOR/PF11160_8/0_45Hva1_TUDOR/PF11160_8/3_3e03DUF812/PF05667_11/0_14DUF812/PF05667_11/1_1e03_NODE_4_length_7126_cov_97_921970_g3_i057837057
MSLPAGVGDPYAVLGLAAPSTPQQYELRDIRQAYRRRALELHPDKNPDDPQAAAKFNRLAVVLEYLSDQTNRDKYDAVLVEQARRRQHAAAQDAEKKRLAAELKRREAAHRAAKAAQSDTQFLQKAFKSRAAEDPEASKRWEKIRRQAEVDRLVLKDLADRKRKAETPSPAAVSQAAKYEVDAQHFYILTLHWHPSEKGMGAHSRKVLETLLRPPFSIQRCDGDAGFAHVQFLSQAAALGAAMTFTVIEDDTLEFISTGLSPNATFSARVVKKPRGGTRTGHVRRSVEDEEEDDRLYESRMAKELASKEAAAKAREQATKIIAQFDVASDDETETETAPSARAHSEVVTVKTPPNARPLPASLMARLNLPTAKPPASAPCLPTEVTDIRTDDDEGDGSDEDELEASTIALLRQAVARKKARLQE